MEIRFFFDNNIPARAKQLESMARELPRARIAPWSEFSKCEELRVVDSYTNHELPLLRAAALSGAPLVFLCPAPESLGETYLCLDKAYRGVSLRRTRLMALHYLAQGLPLALGTFSQKQRRLRGVQERMTRQRTLELEGANELLQRQADEIKHALELLEQRHTEMEQEINLASELQKSLLPRDFPRDIPLDFAHKFFPLSAVGGDFFDVVRIGEHRLGLIITDVSGHGVAPAFITAMFKSAFGNLASNEDSPARLMARLNALFVRTLRTEHYLTCFYAILDWELGECRYCNAGHPKQILLRSDGSLEELGSMGFFLGMFDDTEYEDRTTSLSPGDCLCLFSDGIMETQGSEGKAFGRDGIVEVLREYSSQDLDQASDALMARLLGFMQGPAFEDDITYLIVRLRSLASAGTTP